MKKSILLLGVLISLFFAVRTSAQNLVCNDLVFVSLGPDCSHTLVPDEILEGIVFSNCIVELDKTPPFNGNGPWVPGVLGPADINQTYQVRVRHIPSGNLCWGNLKAQDKLPPTLDCDGLSTVSLANGSATVPSNTLSVIANDPCGAVTLSPANLTFDCADLGVSTVQLTATDGSGNTSTCQHTVLVADSDNTCQFCVSECPESVSVSYQEGTNILLPAFVAGDLTPFDPYGNALFDPGCGTADSTYSVNYQQGAAGQNWFVRDWAWDLGGFPIHCKQYILFPNTLRVTVEGEVYLDSDEDCTAGSGEQRISSFPLQLVMQPSGAVQAVSVDAAGAYSVEITFTPQDTAAELEVLLPAGVNPVCASVLHIPVGSAPSQTFDFGVQTEGQCPQMEVDLGSMWARRCSSTVFNIFYCNQGLDTAYSAYLELNLDPKLSLESADLPYTVSGPDDIYTFQLGDVPPFYCGTIAVTAFVSCNAQNGQSLCNEVYIFPDSTCNGDWKGAQIKATAACDGDSVRLTLRNIGDAAMTGPHDFIVAEDFIMYQGGTYQLDAGGSMTLSTPANGATWRIETQQVSGAPASQPIAAAVEGCNGLNTPGAINAYSLSPGAETYDQECSVVVGSYDPNDKTALPTGYTDAHIIRANTDIQYKIRFQNTGTDAAYRVVIVDTLSALLDPRTLEAGASSHPYHLKIYPGNILHFVFDPIVLPDSNTNLAASQGFVQFRIAQQPDLPDGTLIENRAGIYFDQNDPIITNTAFHTVGYPLVPNPPLVHAVQSQPVDCHGAATGSIEVNVDGGIPPYQFVWSNPALTGNTPGNVPAGLYYLTCTDSYRGTFVDSVLVMEPTALTLTGSSTPATGSNDGTVSVTAEGGTGGYTYLWSTGATTAQVSGLPAGNYTVTVTDANGCTKSVEVTLEQLVSQHSPADWPGVRAWPNPAHDQVTVDLRQVLPKLLRLDVFAADGRLLRQLQGADLKPQLRIPVEASQAGSFVLLALHDREGRVHTEKVMVER